MDQQKCEQLKRYLEAQPWPPLVSIERFFDGNDDEGSIGCNLNPHPGLPAFRRTLIGLLSRADVSNVYVEIAEIDPDPQSWPFADRVFVSGSITVEELRHELADLGPDEVGSAILDGFATEGVALLNLTSVTAWWD